MKADNPTSVIDAPNAICSLSLERMRSLVEEIGTRVFEPVAPLNITAWRTREPVSFAKRFSGAKLVLQPGDQWGENLFDCAWFQFSAELKPEHPGESLGGPLVARIDINGELYIADPAGVPMRGLTCVKSVFERSLGIPAKTVFEIPPDWIREGKVNLWADAAFNDLFGSLPNGGRIEFAYLARCRKDIRDLYYDVESLVDLAGDLPEGNSFREEIAGAMAAVEEALGGYKPESIAMARSSLNPLLQGGISKMRVSALGHAHLDLAWLWPIRETIRKGARTFATALYNMERYPEYLFGCSQPQLYAWIKGAYPKLYSRIRAAVKAGRIEPQGTFWVEPDCNIPCGESFVRQILHGAKFFREEFGIVPEFCWQPDVFGYHGQLPQILSKSGHRYFMTQKLSWNVVNRFPYHSFHWKGIDGSEVLVHMLPEETYNSPAAPRSLRKIQTHYAQRDVSNEALMVFGIGDGGGGPDAEHLERLRRASKLPGVPEVKIRPAKEFFERWSKDAAKFPCWSGELYLERHQGTLTTQARVKRNNRKCEIALRELEWVSFLAQTYAGLQYPDGDLDRLWKEALLYQFHDILPGSSIKRVYEETNARYALMRAELDQLLGARYEALASRIDGSRALMAFNSLGWNRREWIQWEGTWWLANVPAMGCAALEPWDGKASVIAEIDRLENQKLRVTFAGNGTIASVYHKGLSREVFASGEEGNQFVVFEDTGDAWDFATNHETKDVWVYLRQNPTTPSLESQSAWIDGPCAVMEQVFSFGSSQITQKIRLREDSEQLEFDTNVDWHQPSAMLRVRFPLAINPPMARCEIPFGSIARSTREDNPVEKAQIEVASQQWVDLAEENFGVALLNDCKYGFRLKGHTIDMALIRSVPHPGTALIGKDDRSGTEARREFTDLGTHRFRYALLPHDGGLSEAGLTQAARCFNVPLKVLSPKRTPKSGPCVPMGISWIAIDNPAIEIAALKKPEQGPGWILRTVNVTPQSQQAQARFNFPIERVGETDLTENNLSLLHRIQSGELWELQFAPFEIKTLHLC